MKISCSIRFIILISLFIPAGFISVRAEAADLRVRISGFPSTQGRARISLYNAAKGFPDDAQYALRKGTATINDEHADAVFTDIPAGTYAVSVYHDENDNHKLDKSFLGIPLEAVGASCYTAPIMGKPLFSDALFVVDKMDCDISILLFSPRSRRTVK
jgi:uncharacterized protein (DUF2141 family)